MEKLLLRPWEAAEIIGISRSKMYELLSEGQIPVVKIDKSIRISVEELKGWIEEKTI